MKYAEQLQARQVLHQEAKLLTKQLEDTFGEETVDKHHELQMKVSGAEFLLDRLEETEHSIISHTWVAGWTPYVFGKLINGWSEDNNISSVDLAKELRDIRQQNQKAMEELLTANPGFMEIYNKRNEVLIEVYATKVDTNGIYGCLPATPALFNKESYKSKTGQMGYMGLAHNPDLTPSQDLSTDETTKVPSQLDIIQSDSVIPEGHELPQVDNHQLKSQSIHRHVRAQRSAFSAWRKQQTDFINAVTAELGEQYQDYQKVQSLHHDLNYINFILFRAYNPNRRLTQGIINKLNQQHLRDMLQPYFAYTIGKVQDILNEREAKAKAEVREFGKYSPTLQQRIDALDNFDKCVTERMLMTNSLYGSFGTPPDEKTKSEVEDTSKLTLHAPDYDITEMYQNQVETLKSK